MRIITESASETKRLGKKLSKKLKPTSVVALFGDLGSGKTVLVKGMASGLGINARDVVSPTFVLLKEYRSKIPLYHFDLYRIKNADIYKLGFDEYFYGDGICLIEWADRIKDQLPSNCLRIEISIRGHNKRLIKVSGRESQLL